jgi:hypothetical protein
MKKPIAIAAPGAGAIDKIYGSLATGTENVQAVIGRPKGGGPTRIAFFSFGEGWTEASAAAWIEDHAESAAAQVANVLEVVQLTAGYDTDLTELAGEFEFDGAAASAIRNPNGSYKITGLRIAQVGLHTDRNKRQWNATPQVLNDLRDHFAPLAQRGWRVPLVWSHDLDPREADGPLPHIALGWMSNARREGEWLMADVDKIPPGIFRMMKAGAWSSVSPRILRGVRVGDYTATWAVAHLSLCGAQKAAIKGLRTFDDIAGLYAGMTQHEERAVGPAVSFEGALAFDDAEPDKSTDGQGGSPASTRGGSMPVERNDALAALGLTEGQVKAAQDAPGKIEAAEAAQTKAEGERDKANTDLDEARKAQEKIDLEVQATAAGDFAEGHMKKVTVPNRQRIRAIHQALAGHEGDLEFSEETDGKTTTVTVNPLEAFCELTNAVLKDAEDIVDLDEHGKKITTHPGDGKDKKDAKPKVEADDQVKQDDGTVVEGTELADAADKLAKKIIAEARKGGEVLEYADVYEDALEELTLEAENPED